MNRDCTPVELVCCRVFERAVERALGLYRRVSLGVNELLVAGNAIGILGRCPRIPDLLSSRAVVIKQDALRWVRLAWFGNYDVVARTGSPPGWPILF